MMKKYFNMEQIPSVFLITIMSGKSQMTKKLKKCTIFDFKTSFGHKRSRFDPFCFNIDELSYVRVSIGYEDRIDTIIAGINELLDQC